MKLHLLLLLSAVLLPAGAMTVLAADPPPVRAGDAMIAASFRAETAALADRCLADVRTLEDWTSRREEFRRQLLEMLGLWPVPDRTPLNATLTGRVEHPEFSVEKLHFQSRPGLYVTGNLYLPRGLQKPAPAVLYVCGHGNVKKDGISYGSKASYQHHGAWLARNGYVCLVIDTLQLGEIEGLHHGTYREKMWWWWSRGYTPAGVEAWNSIRALDYLQSRREVDGSRLGVTGRSGGGAYSWWLAALDERIRAAVPVAGITDLENHVVDGTVEGHCDCMFMVNTYRWDFAKVAALVAPRPLLIANSDKDTIFPLEGVIRVHAGTRKIYRLYNAADRLGLLMTEGPHRDTQDLQVPALRWFNRWLKEADPLVETAAVKLFEPEQLKVYTNPPADQKNTDIHDSFVPSAPPAAVPQSEAEWGRARNSWMTRLREITFRGWPEEGGSPDLRPAFSVEREGIQLRAFDFTSQAHVRLRLYVAQRAGPERPELVVLNALDDAGWRRWTAEMGAAFAEELAVPGAARPEDRAAFASLQSMFRRSPWAMAYVAPRGVGPTAWDPAERKQIQHRRRFALLGQTWEGMQVWDVRRAAQALRAVPGMKSVPLWMQAEKEMAGVALYASLFEPEVTRLDLWDLPASHRTGPPLLNVLRILDLPQAVAMAAERSQVRLYTREGAVHAWEYPASVVRALRWGERQLQVRAVPPS